MSGSLVDSASLGSTSDVGRAFGARNISKIDTEWGYTETVGTWPGELRGSVAAWRGLLGAGGVKPVTEEPRRSTGAGLSAREEIVERVTHRHARGDL